MAGLSILKHTHNLSNEELCARWIENPYYQLFCGGEFFVHKLPFDRSSLTRWRQRMSEEKLVALIQESLNAAIRTGAAKPSDFARVIVDSTVQPKAVAFPTDAKLMHRARERLVRLAQSRSKRFLTGARIGRKDLKRLGLYNAALNHSIGAQFRGISVTLFPSGTIWLGELSLGRGSSETAGPVNVRFGTTSRFLCNRAARVSGATTRGRVRAVLPQNPDLRLSLRLARAR
jgi:hypothetical protein